MTRVAPFQPARFDSAAPHYVSARQPYAPALIERLVAETGLDQGLRVLDLGCGPGTLAIPLARHAGTVTGIDPNPEMIAAATDLALKAGVSVAWQVGSSADIDTALAPLDLVVMGRSFHWMDREATLARLDALIVPEGAVALLNTESLPSPSNGWLAAYDAVRSEFAHRDEFDAYRKTSQWEPHHAVLLRSPFRRLERFGVIEERTVTVGMLVSRALSQSTTTPKALGARREAFVAALEERLLAVCPDGHFPEIVESVALLARRAV